MKIMEKMKNYLLFLHLSQFITKELHRSALTVSSRIFVCKKSKHSNFNNCFVRSELPTGFQQKFIEIFLNDFCFMGTYVLSDEQNPSKLAALFGNDVDRMFVLTVIQ